MHSHAIPDLRPSIKRTDPRFVKSQANNTQLTKWAPALFSVTPRPGFHAALCYSLSSCSVALLARCPSLWSSTQIYGQQCGGNVLSSLREEQRWLEDSKLYGAVGLLCLI